MEQEKHEKALISWIAPEYVQHTKDKKWYFYAAIAVAVTVFYALVTDNWTMALAIIVFAFVYQYLQAHHPPKNIAIIITEMGIHVGEVFFPYSHIMAFWIIYKNGNKTLNLKVKGRAYSEIVIQLNDQDPAKVRKLLVGEVAELEGKEETFIDALNRMLKL
jgi:hypothetical protein